MKADLQDRLDDLVQEMIAVEGYAVACAALSDKLIEAAVCGGHHGGDPTAVREVMRKKRGKGEADV